MYDIAKIIRELPLDKARSLIMAYFGPIWVKTFLGIEGISAFVSPKEYFAKLMNPNNLFSHVYPLVGRKDLLEQLHGFVESERYSAAIIAGRGGVGKTKILQSFSENFSKVHKDKALFFVNDGVPITQESANDLPPGPCIIVIDDAHRSQDLSIL
jgi:replication-associated recombination protein RarA